MMLLHSLTPPEDGIHHKEDNTHAFINGKDAGNGALYITESQVTWMCQTGQGLNLDYPKICLHAVSRDLSSFPQECLYLMVDGRMFEDEDQQESDSEDEDEPTTEVRFVPTDRGALDAMYSAMSECQALHPDPEDEDSDAEGEEGGQFYEGEEGLNHLSEQGQANLQHYENLLNAGQGDGRLNQNGNGQVEAAVKFGHLNFSMFEKGLNELNLSEQGQANLQHYENLLNAGHGDGPVNQNGNGQVEEMENEDAEEDQGQFEDAEMEQ